MEILNNIIFCLYFYNSKGCKMNKETKLTILYSKTLDLGDTFLTLNRLFENFYFQYDISKKYTLEDLNEMMVVLRAWKKNFESYHKIIGAHINDLESTISTNESVSDDSKVS